MNEKFESALLPVLPLKDMVVFPSSITPLFVLRPKSMAALEEALGKDKRVFLVCQKNPEQESPAAAADLFSIGTVAEVLQVLRVPDGSAKVLIEGQYAARVVEVPPNDRFLQALLVRTATARGDEGRIAALVRLTLSLFETYARISDKIPDDLFVSIRNIEDPLALVHAISNYSSLRTPLKQELLELDDLEEKFLRLNKALDEEIQILELESKIVTQVKTNIGKSQREYFLNEQLKAIEKELGVPNSEEGELKELSKRIKAAGMPKEATAKAEKELERLSRMAPMSPEATVARTYIDWLLETPWAKATPDKIDLARARRILDRDHHGLEKIKDRIVEYLAVTKLTGAARGQILCFVGPPGVGKTSLGRSIARCIGRKFVRVSLGGVRDEAEIRGHRRTYVGALPGKIIQSLKKAGTVNPVFLLDEIDKMTSDMRGDPASAMLEVLDPEQNGTFNDHYLEVDYDLSKVMFITTANTVDGIPLPLQDRMEIIRLAGYTELEKRHIASRFLLPRQLKAHGLARTQLSLDRATTHALITGYTREAGVRNLEREIATLCRKVAKSVVENSKAKPGPVTPERLREFLGPVRYKDRDIERAPEVGNAIGLAWTEVGGELLSVETTIMKGKGNLVLTGKLGDVMQESAKTALSYIRTHAEELGIDPDFYAAVDIHIHVPEGAIPKDGPSAGVAMATSMASVLSRCPVRQDLAMTGEVTLLGKVLKIGGLKEKSIAAHRHGIRNVLVPEDNAEELEELPKEVRSAIKFHRAKNLSEVLKLALVRPKGLRGTTKKSARIAAIKGMGIGATAMGCRASRA